MRFRSSFIYGVTCLPYAHAVCEKQPLSLKSAISWVSFRFLRNLEKFSFDKTTIFDEILYTVRYGCVKIPIDRLDPFKEFPGTFEFRFIIFDDDSPGRFYEHCSKAVDIHDDGRWMDTLAFRFESSTEFEPWSRFKSRLWCAHCEKLLFEIPRP